MTDAYRGSLEALFGRLNYERAGMPRQSSELRLGRIRRLLQRLGDPQDALRIIHVAGTKGKGSTSAMVASALTASGIRTGLFCSPHLHRLEERFQVDGRMASPEEFIALADSVRPASDLIDATDPHPKRRDLTFFEVTTAMGLLHFARQGCEAVVLEVGLGGRLDSTNAIRPLASVLTSISFDHTRLLGNSLTAIATEKAGILKRGGLAVVGTRGREARDAIAQVARQRRSTVRWIDDDFRERYEPPCPPLDRPQAGRVSVQTWRSNWGPVELPLLGSHQAENAATALATLDLLNEQGFSITSDAVARGFASLNFPARVELLSDRPWLVIDGAHNVASASALAETLQSNFPKTSRTLVFGTTRDKDLTGQLRALLPLFDRVIATQYVENPRAVPPSEIVSAVWSLGGPTVEMAADPAEAIARSRNRTPTEGLICVCGSLFLAAETRALLLDLEPSPTTTAAAV